MTKKQALLLLVAAVALLALGVALAASGLSRPVQVMVGGVIVAVPIGVFVLRHQRATDGKRR